MKGKKGELSDKESFVDFGFNGSVEASEGVVAMSIEVTLFLDIILVVFLANVVESEENIDHGHLAPMRDTETNLISILSLSLRFSPFLFYSLFSSLSILGSPKTSRWAQSAFCEERWRSQRGPFYRFLFLAGLQISVSFASVILDHRQINFIF